MLTALDETLMHQAAVAFSQTTVSDHRFFDRMWLGGHRADGTRFLMGLANYKNMNVSDGFFVVYKDGKQHNLRVSRPFLSNPDQMKIGPLSLSVVRPLQQIRVVVEPGTDHPFSADLTFTATADARMELPHIKRVDGRLTQDYVRFDQHGFAEGWFEVAGERVKVDRWFAARDHSWGVRPNQGGYDPVTSAPKENDFRDEVSGGSAGLLAIYLFFDVEGWGGYIQHQEDVEGRLVYRDGGIHRKGDKEIPLIGMNHTLQFAPGTRACLSGRIDALLANEETVRIDITALTPATCFKGTGYDFGFNDERGLGIYRGDLLESDVYDMAHVEEVILPDGRSIRPWQREGPCAVSVNGGPQGLGYLAVLNTGQIKRYNLTSKITNRKDK